MYTVKFDDSVVKVITKWKKSNPILFKKFEKIIKAIAIEPRQGIGHPEPMVGGGNITYSRRISAHDRIIYNIHDEEVYVVVVELEGHYNDK
jgi:toxin YoeB